MRGMSMSSDHQHEAESTKLTLVDALARKYGVKRAVRLFILLGVGIPITFGLQVASALLEQKGGTWFSAVRMALAALLALNLFAWVWIFLLWWRERRGDVKG